MVNKMFTKGINKALNYIRPLATGHLYYGNKKIVSSISSLIVLNKNGDLLTTAHNADLFMIADETNEVYTPILKEMQNKSPREIKKIEKKYGINNGSLIGMHNILIDVAENPGKLKVIKHPNLDLAIIQIETKKEVLVDSFPTFLNQNGLIGTSICKIGFALPEYKTFYYDEKSLTLKTNNEFMNFPIFPLEGMITRNIADEKNNVTMFETSSTVLPGQSGGPIINQNGDVIGMIIGVKKITGDNFKIDLGIGINSQTIIEFLKQNKIEFKEKNNE